MRFETSEVTSLAADIAASAATVVPLVTAAVNKGALNVKNQMRDEAQSGGSYRHFSGSISYDTTASATSVEAEIGPDKNGPQGALGNILYFGTSNNGPVLDINSALNAEESRFTKAVGDVADGLL